MKTDSKARRSQEPIYQSFCPAALCFHLLTPLFFFADTKCAAFERLSWQSQNDGFQDFFHPFFLFAALPAELKYIALSVHSLCVWLCYHKRKKWSEGRAALA